MKIICLNGPKRSGKDAAARIISQRYPGRVMSLAMADPLKREVMTLWGLDPDFWRELETRKDAPTPELGGFRPRDEYIRVGEMRRAEDEDYWARKWIDYARVADAWNDGAPNTLEYVCMTDCRRQNEYQAAVELVGVENVLLVRIYRNGHTWEGDTGEYLDVLPGGHMRKLGNPGTIHYKSNVIKLMLRWRKQCARREAQDG